MFMGTAGNAGSQTSVAIIRALSLGEIEFRDTFKIMSKELMVSFLCGVALFIVNFAKLMLFDRVGIDISFVVSLTLLATVVLAKFTGCILPLLAKKIGFDPAVMASPFITTIVDAMSLIIYFNIAVRILGI